jgi:hypothetical protein
MRPPVEHCTEVCRVRRHVVGEAGCDCSDEGRKAEMREGQEGVDRHCGADSCRSGEDRRNLDQQVRRH